jgi:hypothetical protein
MKQFNIGTGVAILIVAYLLYKKVGDKIQDTIDTGKVSIKNIVGTNDDVAIIISKWFKSKDGNPFNPAFLKAHQGPVYWKGTDVKRLAIAIHDNINNGAEVYRIISMAKYQQQIAQLSETYYNLYKVHLYKDIEENLNEYDALAKLVQKSINLDFYKPLILSVQYFHMIILFVNKLPKK